MSRSQAGWFAAGDSYQGGGLDGGAWDAEDVGIYATVRWAGVVELLGMLALLGRESGSPAQGSTSGRSPLSRERYDAGDHTVQQIAGLFSVPRTTVYGHLGDAS